MRLIADAMLGRLARWLRALGRDVVCDETLEDHELARMARGDGRLLLTRDRRLCADRGDPPWCRIVEARKPAGQLLELADGLRLFGPGWRDRTFTRCMVCNGTLRETSHRSVRSELPEDVARDPRVRSAGFRRCTRCRRVFWEGSHTRRMRRWLEGVARNVAR